MSKGYLMANLRVDDPEIFQKFSSVALPLIEKYGGKLLARGPQADRHEGTHHRTADHGKHHSFNVVVG